MTWFFVAVLSYLIFAVVFLVDKYLLVQKIPDPKVYAFNVGILRISILLLIPFISFSIPDASQIALSLLAGATFIYALFWFFKALMLFEPSRVVPAIGAILPIFSFLLIFIFSGGQEVLNTQGFLALLFLVVGSVLITYDKAKKISLESLKISTAAAFFLALFFVLSKYVYMSQPFLQGFIWISLGGFLMALLFLLAKEVRVGIFKKKAVTQKKTLAIFIPNQIMGAGANILQSWAVALAPIAYVAIVNALQGVQYAFLLVLAIILSLKFPKILKEEISRDIILQKIVAILIIGGGLALLVL